MRLQENINRIKKVMGLKEEYEKPLHALIEILSPLSFMSEKYRFQVVPYWKTQQPKIYIKKGSAGSKTISTDNIKVHKVFPEGEMSKEDIKNYVNQISQELTEKKESGEKWIKCINCNKKFTQTIHKGKKSLPICPHCGTNNDIVSESEIPVYVRRRLFNDLPNFIRDTYEWLAPWSFNSYEEYISRVIFNVVREISNSSGEENYEEIMKMREKLEPVISKYIVDNFSNEIEEYYLDNLRGR
jgi:hypothetical protein